MKPTINDFLPFYIGCEVQTQFIPYTLEGSVCINKLTHGLIQNIIDGKLSIAKPILRPLESMTKEEEESSKDYILIKDQRNKVLGIIKEYKPDTFKYLLSRHFDLFNLHSQGLCLYRNEKGELY